MIQSIAITNDSIKTSVICLHTDQTVVFQTIQFSISPSIAVYHKKFN